MKKLLSLLGCAALLATTSATAHADTVFNVSGTGTADAGQSCGSNCDFSGTLTINTTTGSLDALNITFAGNSLTTLPVVTDITPYIIVSTEDKGLALSLTFTTTTPDTLIGFQGGTINGGGLILISDDLPLFDVTSGTITGPASATPEPSSLMLLSSGMLGFAGVLLRRFR